MRLVRDREELRAFADAPGDYVLEEYLPDRDDHAAWTASYLSVETVVADGEVHHVALTGRFPTASRFRETGNFIPAIVDARTSSDVLALADRVIAVLGIRDSVLHIEIKLTPDGPRLIEINGRLGARPGYVLSEVSDVNLHAIAFQVAAGVPIDLDGLVPVSRVGFWIMVQPPEDATRVVALDGVDEVGALPDVRLLHVRRGPGDAVDWHEGTDAHILSIRGSTADHESLSALTTAVEEMLVPRYA